jgi:hypothetical protein
VGDWLNLEAGMRALSILFATALIMIAAVVPATAPVQAQVQGANPQGRDCQTVRTCNFARGAAVRGCLSSYSCRACRTVTAPCRIGSGAGQRVCQEVRCDWGG